MSCAHPGPMVNHIPDNAATRAEAGAEAVNTLHAGDDVQTGAIATMADILHHIEACGGDPVAVHELAWREYEAGK